MRNADSDKLVFATVKPRWYPTWLRVRGRNGMDIAIAASRSLSRGIHHRALVTDNMRMTLDFYVRVLGMPIVHGLRTP